MKKHIAFLLVSLLMFLCAVPAFAATVLSTQNLTVDKNPINCEKYNIDGSNYFKLRDIAYLLNNTPSQFAVDWDAATQTVLITSGKAYVKNGSELDLTGGDKSETSVQSRQTIQIDGKTVSDLSVYNIGGNNYFKLRDLSSALGFKVDYDEVTRTAQIDSGSAPKEEDVKRATAAACLKDYVNKYANFKYSEDPMFMQANYDGEENLKYGVYLSSKDGKAHLISVYELGAVLATAELDLSDDSSNHFLTFTYCEDRNKGIDFVGTVSLDAKSFNGENVVFTGIDGDVALGGEDMINAHQKLAGSLLTNALKTADYVLSMYSTSMSVFGFTVK